MIHRILNLIHIDGFLKYGSFRWSDTLLGWGIWSEIKVN